MTGIELRTFRDHMGLTQTALARHLGVSRALVTRWEAGSLRISHRTQLAVYWLDYRFTVPPNAGDSGLTEEQLKALPSVGLPAL